MNQWINSKSAFFPQDRVYDKIENYPPHWKTFYQFLIHISKYHPSITQLYDIGCGSGVYSKLLEIYFPYIKYHGFDLAPKAIEVAIKNYGNYFTLCKWEDLLEIPNKNSIIVANGLIEVVDNPEECLQHILSFGAKFVILQRMLSTDYETYTTIHSGYDIQINESRINKHTLNDIIEKNYKILSNPMLCEYMRPEDDIFYSDFLLEKVN